MFFDEINTKLFALAEKGSQDTYLFPAGRQLGINNENRKPSKQRYTARNGKVSYQKVQETKARLHVQSIAQLTLFDLP